MSNKQQIMKMRYTHEGMMDIILAKPEISQDELAITFGYSKTTISIIVNSDAFKEKLAQRKGDLIDPVIAASLNDRLNAVAAVSLTNLLDKLHATPNDGELALEAAKVSTKALGFGAKPQGVTMNGTFVVALPPRSESSQDWAAEYGRSIPVAAENGAEG